MFFSISFLDGLIERKKIDEELNMAQFGVANRNLHRYYIKFLNDIYFNRSMSEKKYKCTNTNVQSTICLYVA